jgi:molecular chaperone GrpE
VVEGAPAPEDEVEADTTAQQGGDPEGEAAAGPEAEAAPGTDAEADAEGDGEGQDPVVTERADEEPEGDGDAEVPAAEAEVPAAEAEVPAAEADEVPSAVAADLDAATARAESYLDDLRRLQADFDNYRKRTLREQTARAASASQALVARLLPVLDNFELAVSHAEQSRDFDGMLKGVEMVFGELREVLQGEGLVRIEAEGKPFDPERHEAVVAVEQEGAEPGTVVDVVRNGYELRGRVLRPAMVKVAK